MESVASFSLVPAHGGAFFAVDKSHNKLQSRSHSTLAQQQLCRVPPSLSTRSSNARLLAHILVGPYLEYAWNRWMVDAASSCGSLASAVPQLTAAEEHIEDEEETAAAFRSKHLSYSAMTMPSSPFSSATADLSSSLRRSLQNALKSLGFLPVTHSIFRARSLASGRQSLTRGLVTLVAGGLFVVLWHTLNVLRKAGLDQMRSPPLTATYRELALRAEVDAARVAALPSLHPLRLAAQITAIPGAKGTLALTAAYAALLVSAVTVFAGTMGTLRVLGWVSPPRDDFQSISSSMQQLSLALSAGERDAINMPPVARASTRWGWHWALGQHPFLKDVFLGPLIEEGLISSLAAPIVWVASFLPGIRGSSWALLAVRLASSMAITGVLHPAHKRPSAMLLTIGTTLLYRVSPWSSMLLPTLFHVLVNYLTRDVYAAISPLRGLQIDVAADGSASWTVTEASQQSSQRLREELFHFVDPQQKRWMISVARFVREAPLLRMLVPARKHAMFARLTPAQRAAGKPRPSATTLSNRYASVVGALFHLLDESSQGFLDERALGVLLLLRPEHLDVLRGAFVALDAELVATERLERSTALNAAYANMEARLAAEEARNPSGKSRTTLESERMDREHRRDVALQAITKAVVPLEPLVVHVARDMPSPDEDAAHQPPPQLSYPCAEWLGLGAQRRSLDSLRGDAKDYLVHTLRSSGGQVDPRNDDDEDPSATLGWSLGFFEAFLKKQGVPGSCAMGGAPPPPMLGQEASGRFLRLNKKFLSYTILYIRAIFKANLLAYGEEIPDESYEPEPTVQEDGGEEERKEGEAAPVRPPYSGTSTRRFTARSLYALLVDLALLDVQGTDALLAHAVLVLHGTLPHPMSVFNVMQATFTPAQR